LSGYIKRPLDFSTFLRQRNAKPTSLSFTRRLDPDAPIVMLDNLAAKSRTQTYASTFISGTTLQTLEDLKQPPNLG